jgi:hypothetical protein
MFKCGRIFLIYKKDNPFIVNNYRPITLLNTCYKIYTAMINKRLVQVIENRKLLGNEQGGFCKHRSCSHKIGLIANVINDANAHGQELHTATIDFEKVFDSVSHATIWKSLDDYGFAHQFVDEITALYDQCTSDIITGQGITEEFYIQKGVRQGDTISPTLFNLVINKVSKLLSDTKGYTMYNNNKVKVNCELFADDIILLACTKNDLQEQVNTLSAAIEGTGLCVNVNKCTYASNTGKDEFITMNDVNIKDLD